MGFKGRLKKSKRTLDLFIDYCSENDISYAYSGYEELKQSKKFKNAIKNLDSDTAKRIRYFPDLIIANEEAWLLEIKNSIFIEKDAYLTYIDLFKIRYNVAIINLHKKEHKKELSFIPIDKLELQKVSTKLPHDKIWIYPRRLPDKEYLKWKEDSEGSGTPFGIIDFSKSESKILIKDIDSFVKQIKRKNF